MTENVPVVKKDIDQKTVEDFLFSTGTKLDDQQRKLFFSLSIRNQLDPFKREIHAITYKNHETGKNELSVVTGYEVYLKRAERSGKLNGWKCWTEGDLVKGTLKAIIEIERKDWSKPLRHEVNFSEYDLKRSLWKSKPLTMIKKVAIAQGFRLAFPEELAGIPYTADEIDTHEVIDVTPQAINGEQGKDKGAGETPGEPTPDSPPEGFEDSRLRLESYKIHLQGEPNLFAVKASWGKHQAEWKKSLFPEHWQALISFKDELKKKLEGGTNG